MKQSIFKQSVAATGPNGTFYGEITVTMNYTTKNILRYNPSTHESTQATIYVHKIESTLAHNGQSFEVLEEIPSESNVISQTITIKEKLQTHLTKLANETPVKSFLQQMADIGFQTNS